MELRNWSAGLSTRRSDLASCMLPQQLEQQDYPVIVAVVAHELAHGISRQIVGEDSRIASGSRYCIF